MFLRRILSTRITPATTWQPDPRVVFNRNLATNIICNEWWHPEQTFRPSNSLTPTCRGSERGCWKKKWPQREPILGPSGPYSDASPWATSIPSVYNSRSKPNWRPQGFHQYTQAPGDIPDSELTDDSYESIYVDTTAINPPFRDFPNAPMPGSRTVHHEPNIHEPPGKKNQ